MGEGGVRSFRESSDYVCSRVGKMVDTRTTEKLTRSLFRRMILSGWGGEGRKQPSKFLSKVTKIVKREKLKNNFYLKFQYLINFHLGVVGLGTI